MATRKRGQVVQSEARTLVQRIANKCYEEAVNGKLFYPLHMPITRSKEYTGLSSSTIQRIKNESPDANGVLPTPEKRRRKKPAIELRWSEKERKVIRDIIYNFYIDKKIAPTTSELLNSIREEINFPWGSSTLRKLLRNMGYKRKKFNVGKVIIEKPDVVACRHKYLKALFYYRKENRNIIFIDETWVDNSRSFGKCWQISETLGTVENTILSDRLIIVHAGGKNGFVPKAKLIFKAGSPSDMYEGQINADSFQKWIVEHLLPNIPAQTVVVMNGAPYRWVEMNKPPSEYAKKTEMISWLVQNHVPHSADMRKYELSELINRFKPVQKSYKIEQILRLYNHTLLCLPIYNWDLNPFELIWAQLRKKIQANLKSTPTLTDLQSIIEEAIDSVTLSDWENFCKRTEEIEQQYWDKDSLLDLAMDDLTLNIEDIDSDLEQDDSSSDEL